MWDGATRFRESKAAMALMGRAIEAIGRFRGEREQGAQVGRRRG